MKLKDLCILNVACCTPDVSIVRAAQLMRQQHTGDLIVVDDADEDREPIGIVTDRDIVLEVIAQGHDPGKTTVGEVMAKQLVIASGSEDVDVALERMRTHGVRRLPIVDDGGSILGVLTLDDLLRVHAEQATALLTVVTKEQTRENRARR